MNNKIAVPTLTPVEVVKLFKESETKLKKRMIFNMKKAIKNCRRLKISKKDFVLTYTPIEGVRLNVYCSYDNGKFKYGTALIHRTTKGLILVMNDHSKDGWHKIYTSHFCERYAERILKLEPSFDAGATAIMFNDKFVGLGRIIDEISPDVNHIEMRYEFGIGYGYHDNLNKISWLNTVVSNDMLTSDQKAYANEVQEDLDIFNGIEYFSSIKI